MIKFSIVSKSRSHEEPKTESNLSDSTCYKTTMVSTWSDVEDDLSEQHLSGKRSNSLQLPQSEHKISDHPSSTSSEHLSSDHNSSEISGHSLFEDLSIEAGDTSLSPQHLSDDENDDVPMPVVIADYNQTRLEELRVDASLSPISNSGKGDFSTPFVNANPVVNSTQVEMDSSFVFVKPEFNCIRVRDLIRSIILDNIKNANGRIAEELVISGGDIEKGKLIDKHYRELSENAMHLSAKEMHIPKLEFRSAFDEDVDNLIKSGEIFNAQQAMVECHCSAEELDKAWQDAELYNSTNEKVIKFRRGLYCGKVQINRKYIYVINGFYMAMRKRYMEQHESIYAFIVHWNSSVLSWNEFLKNVIGAKNPVEAKCRSIRKLIYENYDEYGLSCKPNNNHNVVHASASPLQGLIERCNWLSRHITEDEYGQILLRKGVPESIILEWSENHEVKIPKSSKLTSSTMQLRRIFDIVKGMDTVECTKALVQLYDYELFRYEEKVNWCCMS